MLSIAGGHCEQVTPESVQEPAFQKIIIISVFFFFFSGGGSGLCQVLCFMVHLCFTTVEDMIGTGVNQSNPGDFRSPELSSLLLWQQRAMLRVASPTRACDTFPTVWPHTFIVFFTTLQRYALFVVVVELHVNMCTHEFSTNFNREERTWAIAM